jgi:magnesium transporter
MEEIELSSRLYHEGDAVVLTVVLPGEDLDGHQIASPVAFLLSHDRLVTVRHHAPRPFQTFPTRGLRMLAGSGTPERVFLGLIEEIGGRLADLLEQAGKVLDDISRGVFGKDGGNRSALLQSAIERIGQQGEAIGRVRLAMLTLERALSFYSVGARTGAVRDLIKNESRDLKALAVHSDHLMTRVGLTLDATLGMINLAQNATIRVVSVVTMLFLPPTLVASAYGMNLKWMPFLHSDWGFEILVALMLGSALGTWAVFRRRGWL